MTIVLTSLELVPVGEGVVNVKSVLGAHTETALVLIKAHIQKLLSLRSLHFLYYY